MAATYCVRGDLRETQGERGTTEKEDAEEEEGEEEEEERKEEISLSCPFSCTVKVDVLFSTRRVSRGCFMAIVCARQMAQKRDRMLPLGEPSGLKYDRGDGPGGGGGGQKGVRRMVLWVHFI